MGPHAFRSLTRYTQKSVAKGTFLLRSKYLNPGKSRKVSNYHFNQQQSCPIRAKPKYTISLRAFGSIFQYAKRQTL